MPADVFFTTNPAEFSRLEGLYISERNPPGFIRGRDLSHVGIAGVAVRGPSTPQVITSTGRFLEVYGGRDYGSGGALVSQLWRALLNKPMGLMTVRRVVAADAVTANFDAETAAGGGGTAVLRVAASSPGIWGNDVQFRVFAASDGDANHFNLTVKYLGVPTTYVNLDISGTNDNLAETVGDDVANLIVLSKLAAGRPVSHTPSTDGADADGFVNLGEVVAAFTSVAGSNGTLVSGDYLAGMADLAAVEGPTIVLMAGASVNQAALNGAIVTHAAAVSDRVFLTWSGTFGQTPAQAVTSVGTDITTRSDRIVYCYNAPFTLDPETGLEVQTPAHEWMASVLSQNDVDIHPGSQQTSRQTAGIKRLTNQTLTRADLITLRDAGISTLEKLPGQFLFRSGVTTDLTPGKTEITRRRSADFLQLSASDRLRFFVKAKNTLEARAQMAGELTAFSQSLKDIGRVVEEFAIEQESVNTASGRAQGIEKILWRVRLIGHILHLVLETEIGTGVVVEA